MNWFALQEIKEQLKNQNEARERKEYESWAENNPEESHRQREEILAGVHQRMENDQRRREQESKENARIGGVLAILIIIVVIFFINPGLVVFLHHSFALLYGASLLIKIVDKALTLKRKRATELRRDLLLQQKKELESEEPAAKQSELARSRENDWIQLKAIIPSLSNEDVYELLGINNRSLRKPLNAYRRAKRNSAHYEFNAQPTPLDLPGSNQNRPKRSADLPIAASLMRNSDNPIAPLLSKEQTKMILLRYERFKAHLKQGYFAGEIKLQKDYFQIISPVKKRLLKAGFDTTDLKEW